MVAVPLLCHPHATLTQIHPNCSHFYKWNAANREHQSVLPSTLASQLPVGTALWAYSTQDQDITIRYAADPPEELYADLVRGWQLLGNPFSSPAKLHRNSDPQERYYWWDASKRQYVLLSQVGPGMGAWMLVQNDGTCTWKASSPSASGARTAQLAALDQKPKVDKGGLCVKLAIRSANFMELCWFGVTATASAVRQSKPPPAPGGVSLYLDTDEYGVGYGTYLVHQNEKDHTWQLLALSTPEQRVELYLPDTSELEGDVAVWLQDMATGQKTDLRHTRSYSYTTRSGQRQFKLWLGQASQPLQILSLYAQPTSAAVNISFALSAAGKVSVEVYNIAGRLIRKVIGGREYESGLATLSWNGVSDGGTKVPPGIYLIRVSARGAGGGEAQALTTLRLH